MFRCKFRCTGIFEAGTLITVNFAPVKDGIFGENTPCATVSLGLIKDVADKFEVGQEYYLDFNQVEAQ